MSRARLLGPSVLAGALVAMGCTGKPDSLNFSSTLRAESVGTSMSACPTLDVGATVVTKSNQPIITKACIVDDQGRYYGSGLSSTPSPIPIVPGGHRHSFVYVCRRMGAPRGRRLF
jgi:hypothetical protein